MKKGQLRATKAPAVAGFREWSHPLWSIVGSLTLYAHEANIMTHLN